MSDALREAVETAPAAPAPAVATPAAGAETPGPLAFEGTPSPSLMPSDDLLTWRRDPLPGMLGRLQIEEADGTMGGDNRLGPAWQARFLDAEINESVERTLDAALSDPELSTVGVTARLTRKATVPALKKVRELVVSARAQRTALEAEGAAIVPRGAVPEASAEDRVLDMKIAEAVLSTALIHARSADPMAKARAIDEASRDPRVRLALARTPEVLWGGTTGAAQRLRDSYAVRPTREQEQRAERVRAKVATLTEAILHLEKLDRKLDAASDRAVLKSVGLARLHRSDFTNDAERCAYIREYGLDKFTALPR